MKKLLQITAVAVLVVLSLGITSCAQNSDSEGGQEVKVVDFRNKKSDGTVLSRVARDAEVVFNSEFKTDINEYDKHSFYKVTKEANGNIYDEKDFVVEAASNGDESKAKLEAFAENVKITSHKDGFQVEFTAPEGFEELDFWGLSYIDGNGNNSTGVEKVNAIIDGTLSVVYPLVIKGTPATIFVHLGSLHVEDAKHWEAQLYFSVTPVNGLGCVEDMPKDFDSSDYLDIEDGHILKVSKMVPPMAQNLTRSFQLNGQDKGTQPYGIEGDYAVVKSLGFVVNEKASELETDACAAGEAVEFTIDLKEYTKKSDDYVGFIGCDKDSDSTNQPYIWAIFGWSYTLDDFPGYTFITPGLWSKVVANTEFLDDAE